MPRDPPQPGCRSLREQRTQASEGSLASAGCGWLPHFCLLTQLSLIVDSWCLSYFQPSLEGQFWLNLRHLEWELGAGSSHLGPQGMRQAQSSGLRQRL